VSVTFVEGPAGTGKTTTLMTRLVDELVQAPLADAQRVLAITKMHGSRRRVQARLNAVAGLNGRFECITIDSFARRLALRWRSLARVVTGRALPEEFDAVCTYAAAVLEIEVVQRWVAAAFPIVVVDELQDSKGGQLRLLEQLTARSRCLLAGDPFQDLEGDTSCQAVDWARAQCEATVLSTVHRTKNPALLSAASALRDGKPVLTGVGFSIVGVPKPQLGAWEVASRIAAWKKEGTIAVLSPAGPGSSPFVRDLVARVAEAPLGQQWRVGPFTIPWEAAFDAEVAELCAAIGIDEATTGTFHADALPLPQRARHRVFHDWLRRQRRLHGRREFSAVELRDAASRLIHQVRAHRGHGERSLAGMLVHQAKNREFDRVIVLWPFNVVGTEERLRRIAYNAVTRARHAAAIVVHGEERIAKAPFFATPTPRPKRAARKRSAPRRRGTASDAE
jgi:hypothetical protein